MALWMTVQEEWFGLAAVLLVLACIKLGDSWRARKDRRTVPALLLFAGMAAGAVRMEREETILLKEWKTLTALEGFRIVCGEVEEISETDYGYRLILKSCRIAESGGKADVRRLYCYLDEAENMKLGMEVQVGGDLEPPESAGNPGQFDFRSYCSAKGISGILYGETVEVLSSRYLLIRENLRQFGEKCSKQLDTIAESEDAGILKAVLVGKKAGLEEEIYESYRRNGVSHVLAISGLHVSVIGMGFWCFLRKIGMGYCGAGAIAFACLFAYGSVTGFGPSVIRAVSMMGLSFFAGVFGRTYDLPTAMCAPAIGLLLWKPFLLTQASFQLSFLAVGAIFFPGDFLARRWGWTGRKKDLLVSASIHVVTMPAVLFHSYEIPPYGIFLNLVVIPLMTYVLISGLASLAVSFFSIGAARFCLGGAHYILKFYQGICGQVQKIPGASLIWGRPSMFAILLFYLILLQAIYLAAEKRPAWIGLGMAGGLLFVPVSGPGMEVTFLDVGQGDGILIEAGGRTMLVDCGSSQTRSIGEDCLVPFLKYHGIRRLDAIAVSHGDQDHVNGIQYLLETPECGISVGALVLPDDGALDETEAELIDLAKERDIPVVLKHAGESMDGVLGEDVKIRCLHPYGPGNGDRNENSLVLQVEYQEFRMLLTGDAGEIAEARMLQ